MDILITLPDEQWEAFKQAAQEAVEMSWDGKYEDFATYIMTVNLETYIKSQQKKQEKKIKRALASYEESMAKEASALTEKPETVLPSEKLKRAPREEKEKTMTNKELSERIAQLEEVAVKKRTLAEAEELERLLTIRKKPVAEEPLWDLPDGE